MIGRIVERILNEGFDVWVHRKRLETTGYVVVNIRKFLRSETRKEVVEMSWMISDEELQYSYEHLLFGQCDHYIASMRKRVDFLKREDHELEDI